MKLLGLMLVLTILVGCGSQNLNNAPKKEGANQLNSPSANKAVTFLDIKPSNGLNKPSSARKSAKMGDPIEVNGQVIQIGTLGGSESVVEQANNGYVVGGSNVPIPQDEVESEDVSDLTMHAFIHKDGVMKDIGTLGGAYSSASGVNSTGIAVGGSQLSDSSYQAFKYENNAISGLVNLSGGNHSWAYSINDGGYIVGEAKDSSGAPKAVLWDNGNIVDLNSFLPAESGWVLTAAKSISNTGEVKGVGKLNGQKTYFQLKLNITE